MGETPGRGVRASKDSGYWREQIAQAEALRKQHEPWWEANLKAYAPRATDSPDRYGAEINTNRDFTLVERKKADLFYQRPEVSLQPSPLTEGPILDPMGQPVLGPPSPQTGQPGAPIPSSVALAAHEDLVNEHLGPDGVNATRMVHATLFDVEVCGIGFTVMGYESATVAVDQVDPLTGQITSVPVPIKEACFWEHLSPKQALIPRGFRSTDFDRAPWLGYRFELPLTTGNRDKFKLPPDFMGSKSESAQHFDHGLSTIENDQVFSGVLLWYRSCLYREDRPHPDHLTKLVIVDGIDQPVIEEDSPDQTLDARGQLTPDSLIGFPMHPLTTRTLTDAAYPPSDCTLIRPLVNELNLYRTQQVQFRDAATLKWIYNTDTLPPESVAKIVRAPIGGMIGVPSDAFLGDGAIKELPQGSMPRENFQGQQAIDDDIARTTAIDASGAGVQSTTNQTATEAQIQQGNANARLDFERGVVLQWYCHGVTKYATLLQRYLPVASAAKVIGPARAPIWDVWRKTVPATLAFTAMPDSALRVDQAVDRKQALDFYSFIRNDSWVAPQAGKLLEKLFRKYHLDPTGIVVQPQPAKPEPPKLAFSFKGDDLIGPQAPIVIEIAAQLGLTIKPETVQLSQALLLQSQQLALAAGDSGDSAAGPNTRHGGKQPQSESLSKHHADMSGGMQGVGGTAQLGAAGGHLQ